MRGYVQGNTLIFDSFFAPVAIRNSIFCNEWKRACDPNASMAATNWADPARGCRAAAIAPSTSRVRGSVKPFRGWSWPRGIHLPEINLFPAELPFPSFPPSVCADIIKSPTLIVRGANIQHTDPSGKYGDKT